MRSDRVRPLTHTAAFVLSVSGGAHRSRCNESVMRSAASFCAVSSVSICFDVCDASTIPCCASCACRRYVRSHTGRSSEGQMPNLLDCCVKLCSAGVEVLQQRLESLLLRVGDFNGLRQFQLLLQILRRLLMRLHIGACTALSDSRHITLPYTCVGHVQVEHSWIALRRPALGPRRRALPRIGRHVTRRICLTLGRRLVHQLSQGGLFTQRHQQFTNLCPLLPNAIPPLLNTWRPLSTPTR